MGREEDTKVEHFFRFRVELGMRREGAGIIEPSAESELAAGLQIFRIKLPGKPLLPKGEKPAAQRINAYIGRRFQPVVRAIEHAVRKFGPKNAEQRPVGSPLFCELARANIAAPEPNLILPKTQHANHAITVEPMAVRKLPNPESRGAVEVARAPHKVRDGPSDVLNY